MHAEHIADLPVFLLLELLWKLVELYVHDSSNSQIRVILLLGDPVVSSPGSLDNNRRQLVRFWQFECGSDVKVQEIPQFLGDALAKEADLDVFLGVTHIKEMFQVGVSWFGGLLESLLFFLLLICVRDMLFNVLEHVRTDNVELLGLNSTQLVGVAVTPLDLVVLEVTHGFA